MFRCIAAIPAWALLLVVAPAGDADAQEPPVTDPTLAPLGGPVATVVSEERAWVLYSTRISGPRPIALINDSIVTVGSRVGGADVLEIQSGRVRLRRGENTFTLRLERPSVKRSAASGE